MPWPMQCMWGLVAGAAACDPCCRPMTLLQRAAELADYGFSCGCEKCAAERLAQELLLG